MSLGAVLGIIGGIMSSRAQRKAQGQQNVVNDAAYERQKEAEKERDYLNQYGVYSRLQRGFEESQITQMQRRMRLGGFTPETRQISQDLLDLQRQYDGIGPGMPQASGETDASYRTRLDAAQDSIQTQIDAKLKEKSDLEYTALSEVSGQFDPMRQYEQAAGMGIYDGSMLQQRLESLGIGQGLRDLMGKTRQEYLPGIEGAQNVLYDPSRTDELRALNLQRAEQMDDPATRALRLQAARDRSVIDPMQQGRLDLAETNVAGINQAALAQSQAAGMGRTYGGSSTVLNRTRAGLAMQGSQQAAVARSNALNANLMQDLGLQRKDYAMQAMNLADVMKQRQRVNDAGIQNVQQLEAARLQRDRNMLEQIQNRQGLDIQSLNEQMMSASETDAANLAAQRMQMSNIGLSDKLYGSAVDNKTAVERQQQALDQQRERAIAVAYMGQGGMLPIDVPVPQVSVKDYWGSGLTYAGNYILGQQEQNSSFQNRMRLLKQEGLNMQGMYAPRPKQQQWTGGPPQQNPFGQGNFNMGGGGNWGGGYGGGGNSGWGGGGGQGGPMFGGAGNNSGYQGLGGMGWGGGGQGGTGGMPGFEYQYGF